MIRYFLIAMMCLYGCVNSKQIVGKYADTKSPDSFQFNSDSTFIYQYRAYHAYEYATGKWEIKRNNAIILNSSIQNVVIPSSLTLEDYISNQTSVMLTFEPRIKKGVLSDYKCEIFINDSLFDTRRADSMNKITINKPVNTIFFKIIKEPLKPTSTYFPLFPLVTEKFTFKKNTCVNATIVATIDDKLFGYRVFSNELVKIKNKGIKRFYLVNSRWRTIPKVSDDSNIFINPSNL